MKLLMAIVLLMILIPLVLFTIVHWCRACKSLTKQRKHASCHSEEIER
jgi:hypothetical protein